jgi:hypothetical protein
MRFHLGALAGRGAVTRPADDRPLGYQPSAFDDHPQTNRRAERPAGWSDAGLLPGRYLSDGGQDGRAQRLRPGLSGTLPGYIVERVQAVYSDAKGTPVPLAGQSYLRVVFHGTSAVCPKPLHRTYTGPTVLTPYHPELLTVSAAGDFEGVLSFGIGLAAQGSYHVFTLTSPHRLMIDVSHVALGTFPGIWDITSWPQYWGHAVLLAQRSPAMAVQPVVRRPGVGGWLWLGLGGPAGEREHVQGHQA